MHEFSIPKGLPAFVQEHVGRYLETNGAEGHLWDSSVAGGPGPVPTLLLVTTGRKSGRAQTLPLIYAEASGQYVIVGSKGGAPGHPAWYLNLLSDPEVSVQVGSERFAARARIAEGDEREALWNAMVGAFPPFRNYQEGLERQIPVVVLEQKG